MRKTKEAGEEEDEEGEGDEEQRFDISASAASLFLAQSLYMSPVPRQKRNYGDSSRFHRDADSKD